MMLVCSVLIAWELLLTAPTLGGKSYLDNESLWVETRSRVLANDNREFVLVGASRIQLGINTDVFAKVTGRRPVQLAINGNYPMPVLKHLANSEDFTGIAIVSMTAFWVDPNPRAPTAEQWIAAYEGQHSVKRQPYYTDLEQQLLSIWRTRVLAGARQVSITHFYESIFLGRRLPARYIRVKQDRSVLVDYRGRKLVKMGGQARLFNTGLAKGNNPIDSFLSNIDQVEQLVGKIQSRGGKVIFVRMPSSGNAWKGEQLQYPKEYYWDLFAERTQAMCIHFKDYPELDSYTLPDGSHLDYRDAANFTKSLATIIIDMLKGMAE